MIRYAERIEQCNVLGPGERTVVWVHGCCFHCKGCIADSYKHGPYQEVTPEEMADWYCGNGKRTEGITISGGEPFLQAASLVKMLRIIRQRREIGVIVYTGFLYEKLLARAQTDEAVREFLGEIDLLIDGPYIEEMDENRMAVGSENQRILLLTDRYQNVAEEYYGKKARQVEIRLFDGKGMLVGVPSEEQRRMWKKLSEKPNSTDLEQTEVKEYEKRIYRKRATGDRGGYNGVKVESDGR